MKKFWKEPIAKKKGFKESLIMRRAKYGLYWEEMDTETGTGGYNITCSIESYLKPKKVNTFGSHLPSHVQTNAMNDIINTLVEFLKAPN